MNNMLTLEEVKNFLETNENQVEKWLKEGKLHAYKIGGTYLRFRKEEVMNLRFDVLPQKHKPASPSAFSRVRDFWRFNNFYIISIFFVGMVIYLILKF